ncbi:MAG: DUF3141 domain-containing protein [Alphaproteobacteria bacterium]|nr:DUF3141 domain-containing protein [Alphaproteobacteria bacterium]
MADTWWRASPAAQAWEYWVDRSQRSILFWDVLRKRGNMHNEHAEKGNPPLLVFEHEMVMDGRTLERPCNYVLLRILPEPGMPTDPTKRPFVIIDPRAGHGPGIGGFKEDSQVGVILRAGHPCYFVSFCPEPVEGQTIGDIGHAEYLFLQKVMELHPEADGKPCLIGNCQAGWAIFMLGAAAPDISGPLLLAGSPLSYWQGPEGKDPMRYTGGLLGGTWMTSLAGDLGNGKFDGAYLVQNFENLNPANTLWSKQYNLFSKVDTEAERFLGFEKWWGGLFLTNIDEMRFITNSLFVGNKLEAGEIRTADNDIIDVRNIRSPICIFASWGDNITPPQQAVGWIAEVYDSVDDIRANGQVIIYALHEDVGHLGIFVSSKIAKREYATGIENIDIIDILPPGLYESVIEPKDPDAPGADLTASDYIQRIEPRTIEDIKALGARTGRDPMFETVARLSEINEGMYLTFLSPWVQMMSNETTAEALRRMQPHRAQNQVLSDKNPAMGAVKAAAEVVRQNRRPATPDNPFVAWEQMISSQIVDALDAYRDLRDQSYEQLFKSIYGSPWLQAAVGLKSWSAERAPTKPGRDIAREVLIERELEKIKGRVEEGGFNAALIRMLGHVVRAEQSFDPRILHFAKRLEVGRPRATQLEAKELFKEQGLLMWLDEDAALKALPKLLPTEAERRDAVDIIRAVVESVGTLSPEEEERIAGLESLLEVRSPKAEPATAKTAAGAAAEASAQRQEAEKSKPKVAAARKAGTTVRAKPKAKPRSRKST